MVRLLGREDVVGAEGSRVKKLMEVQSIRAINRLGEKNDCLGH